jgi:hypothetical protein
MLVENEEIQSRRLALLKSTVVALNASCLTASPPNLELHHDNELLQTLLHPQTDPVILPRHKSQHKTNIVDHKHHITY